MACGSPPARETSRAIARRVSRTNKRDADRQPHAKAVQPRGGLRRREGVSLESASKRRRSRQDGRRMFALTTVTLPQPAAMGIRDVIKANPDTFNKLGAFSVALFVLSLGSFFAITRTAVGGAL